jgi:hypothetical protein
MRNPPTPSIGPNGERVGNTGPVELQPNNVPLSGRISVAHVDPNATQCLYAISVGLAQPQDLVVVPANPGLVAPGSTVYLPVVRR